MGSTPTDQVGNEKVTALSERRPGDLVLFYADKAFIARARIAELFRNNELGRAVWDVNEDGETWEHLMALTDVEYLNLPSEEILAPLGINPVVRGLRLLTTVQTAQALDHLPGAAAGQAPASTRKGANVDLDRTEALGILRPLVGATILTLSGRPNVVLGIEGDDVVVRTERSPAGELVPIIDVQVGINLLRQAGEVRVHPDVLGYRSAFVGAALSTIASTEMTRDPAAIRMQSSTDLTPNTDPTFGV